MGGNNMIFEAGKRQLVLSVRFCLLWITRGALCLSSTGARVELSRWTGASTKRRNKSLSLSHKPVHCAASVTSGGSMPGTGTGIPSCLRSFQ